jgi:hypothetical protein
VAALFDLDDFSLSISVGVSEKKATSEPLARAERTSRNRIMIRPITVFRSRGLIITPEKKLIAERGSSGSKIEKFYRELEWEVIII